MSTVPKTNAPRVSRRSGRVTLWSPRWLDALSVLCVAGAIAFALLPTLPTVHPIAPVLTPIAAARTSLPTDSASAQIVAGNVFSATRRAPTVRFVPPGSEADTPPAAPTATVSAVTDDGPRLFGIVSQDGERRALLQLPGADSTPRLLAAGEKHGGYRIVSIAQDRVVLASSAGTRTVRLAPRAPTDSSEKHL